MENFDFDKLISDVLENPELILDSSTISNDQLFELQRRMNPYIGLVGETDPKNKQIAACSYTNLREDYLRRFTMTSLVSFIFQMLHEYEVPKNKRIWVPKNKNSEELFNITELKEKLQGIVGILTDAEEAEKLEKESTINSLITDVDDNTIYKHKEKKIGLLFTVTQMLKELGLTSDEKLHITTEEAKKFPKIKEIINTKKKNEKEFIEREFPNDNAKEIINSFLLNWFSFDPSIHIRSSFNKENIKTEIQKLGNNDIIVDKEDPNHLTIENVFNVIVPDSSEDKEMLNVLTSTKYSLNAARHIIRDDNMSEAIKYAINNSDRFKQYLLPLRKKENIIIPPQDTFHRWNYYNEVNYEDLRTITETLYPDKPDLDWAIAIWKTFKGTENEITEQFNEYCQKHHDEMPSVVKALEIGKWSLLADFKENRKNIQFYNKNTEVLKKIIERHTEDKKIGTELMRNRVRQTKAKNIAEQGPDAPGLKAYKATISSDGKDLASKGAERVITPEEMKRLEKARGDIKAAKELEVIEEYEKLLQGLEDIKKYREFNTEENDKYQKVKEYLQKAKEMINVPEDAIHVDVFTNDTKSGTTTKTHFYTKCDEALEKENK